MAGVTLEFDVQPVLAALAAAADALGDPTLMLQDMGEYLLRTTQERFDTQTAPDGSAWEPLKPTYLRRKKKNKNRILYLDGPLRNQMRWQVNGGDLLVGTDRPYAAAHQFGADIQIAARSQQAYFRQGKDGQVGNRFVSKAKSNFAQRVTLGAYSIHLPARPFLGASEADNAEILRIAARYLENALARSGP